MNTEHLEIPRWARDAINDTTLSLHLVAARRRGDGSRKAAWFCGYDYGITQAARNTFRLIRSNLRGGQWRLALDLAKSELQERRNRLEGRAA